MAHRTRMGRIHGVTSEMKKVYWEMESGERATSDGMRLIQSLMIIRQSMEIEQVESKLYDLTLLAQSLTTKPPTTLTAVTFNGQDDVRQEDCST